MHDINLLPVDDRKRELQEIKTREKAKSEVKIEMSSPDKKIKETDKKSGKFLSNIKNIFNNFKKDKKEIEKLRNEKLRENEKNSNNKIHNKPEVPKHLDNISSNKHSKEFYFKKDNKNNIVNPVKRDKQELEDIVNHPEKKKEEKKQESSLNINLIPSHIKKIHETKNNLKIYLISLMASVIICIIALLTMGQFVSAQRSDLEKIENSIEQTQQDIENLKSNSLEVNDFIKLLRNVKVVINSHVQINEIFKMLQTNTLKNIYYTSLNIDVNNSLIKLQVTAEDYSAAAQQILIYKSLDKISQLEVISMGLVEEKVEITEQEKKLGITPVARKFVGFDLVLKLDSSIFK